MCPASIIDRVCILMTYSIKLPRDLEAFEKAALKEFGSNKEVTLTWSKVLNFRITGNLKPVVEKYQKVKKLFTEARKQNPSIIRSRLISKTQKTKEAEKALKNAIEEIIGDITLGRNIHNQS